MEDATLPAVAEKKGMPDGASREGREDYLAVVGELLPDDAYDPSPLIRGAWTGNPLYWPTRAVTLVGGLTLAVQGLKLFRPVYPEAAAALMVVLPFLIPTWFALTVGAMRDHLAEARPLRLLDQLRRWGPKSITLAATIGIHLLPSMLLFSGWFGEIGLALGWIPALILFFSWFYAASEVVLADAGAFEATGRGLRLTFGRIPRRIMSFFRNFRLRHLVRPPAGEFRLGSVLIFGYFVTYLMGIFGFGLTQVLVDALGLGPGYKWVGLAGSVGGVFAAMAADYTTSHFGGQYVAFLAARRREGEAVVLADPAGPPPSRLEAEGAPRQLPESPAPPARA